MTTHQIKTTAGTLEDNYKNGMLAGVAMIEGGATKEETENMGRKAMGEAKEKKDYDMINFWDYFTTAAMLYTN